MKQLGYIMIAVSGLLAIAGTVLILTDKLPAGRLPGDIEVSGKNWSIRFPVVTCLVVSVVVTLLINAIIRLLRR